MMNAKKTFARVDDLKRKTVDDIKALRAAGYTVPFIVDMPKGKQRILSMLEKVEKITPADESRILQARRMQTAV